MNTEQPFDLDGYLRRVGFTGLAAPTLDTLRSLQHLHPSAIPFENLDPLMGRPVKLDLASLQEKLVRSPRGGYCFEHNLLFARALAEIGFHVTGLAARVLWGQAEDALTARSHMLLRIELPEGTFIADVGFGGQTPTGPLRLIADIEQQTSLQPFRLIAIDDGYKLQARVGEDWTTLYRFDLQRQFPVDYESSNYYVSTNPLSHFTQRVFVARPTAEARFALLNDRLSIHRVGQPSETRALASVAEVTTVLKETFGIVPPDARAFADALTHLGLFQPT